METVGLGFYWHDLEVGRRFKTVGRTVTEADITNFVDRTGTFSTYLPRFWRTVGQLS